MSAAAVYRWPSAVLPQVWAVAEGRLATASGRIGPQRAATRREASAIGLKRPEAKASLHIAGSVREAEAPCFHPTTETTVSPQPVEASGLAFYRKYTQGMLRRYVRFSMESGRVPSMLGRELVRGPVTTYKVRSFDDVVIFVHDVGNCLETLNAEQQHLLKRIALQGYSQGETAELLGLSLRTVIRHYNAALDELTDLLLKRGMMEPRLDSSDSCQGGSA